MADRDVSKNPITRAEKETWLKALRSGEYKQTRQLLKNPDTGGYCCLGVACEVIGDGLVLQEEEYGNGTVYRCWHVSGDTSATETWGNPCYGRSDQAVVLQEAMDMNDEGHSFAEIADDLDVYLVPLEDMSNE